MYSSINYSAHGVRRQRRRHAFHRVGALTFRMQYRYQSSSVHFGACVSIRRKAASLPPHSKGRPG